MRRRQSPYFLETEVVYVFNAAALMSRRSRELERSPALQRSLPERRLSGNVRSSGTKLFGNRQRTTAARNQVVFPAPDVCERG